MSAGMNSSRNTPLLGLAFLISAMTALWPAAILLRRAPTKSRVSTRVSASARIAASGLRLTEAAISSRLTATILSRMSLIGSGPLRLREGHQLLQPALGGARLHRRSRERDAVLHGWRDVGRIERHARVEDGDLARRAGLVVQNRQQHGPGLLRRFDLERAIACHR